MMRNAVKFHVHVHTYLPTEQRVGGRLVAWSLGCLVTCCASVSPIAEMQMQEHLTEPTKGPGIFHYGVKYRVGLCSS